MLAVSPLAIDVMVTLTKLLLSVSKLMVWVVSVGLLSSPIVTLLFGSKLAVFCSVWIREDELSSDANVNLSKSCLHDVMSSSTQPL